MEIEVCAKCAEGAGEDFEPIGTSFAGDVPLVCSCCGEAFWWLVILQSRSTEEKSCTP